MMASHRNVGVWSDLLVFEIFLYTHTQTLFVRGLIAGVRPMAPGVVLAVITCPSSLRELFAEKLSEIISFSYLVKVIHYIEDHVVKNTPH